MTTADGTAKNIPTEAWLRNPPTIVNSQPVPYPVPVAPTPTPTPGPTPPPVPPIPATTDVAISFAGKTVTVSSAVTRTSQAGHDVTVNPSQGSVIYPKGFTLLEQSRLLTTKAGTTLTWQQVLATLEAIVQQYGPTALPIIQQWLVQLGLPGWVSEIILALAEVLINNLPTPVAKAIRAGQPTGTIPPQLLADLQTLANAKAQLDADNATVAAGTTAQAAIAGDTTAVTAATTAVQTDLTNWS